MTCAVIMEQRADSQLKHGVSSHSKASALLLHLFLLEYAIRVKWPFYPECVMISEFRQYSV